MWGSSKHNNRQPLAALWFYLLSEYRWTLSSPSRPKKYLCKIFHKNKVPLIARTECTLVLLQVHVGTSGWRDSESLTQKYGSWSVQSFARLCRWKISAAWGFSQLHLQRKQRNGTVVTAVTSRWSSQPRTLPNPCDLHLQQRADAARSTCSSMCILQCRACLPEPARSRVHPWQEGAGT